MDTQASLSEPHHLKLFGCFAYAVSSANAHPKDFRYLFGSISLPYGLAMIV